MSLFSHNVFFTNLSILWLKSIRYQSNQSLLNPVSSTVHCFPNTCSLPLINVIIHHPTTVFLTDLRIPQHSSVFHAISRRFTCVLGLSQYIVWVSVFHQSYQYSTLHSSCIPNHHSILASAELRSVFPRGLFSFRILEFRWLKSICYFFSLMSLLSMNLTVTHP